MRTRPRYGDCPLMRRSRRRNRVFHRPVIEALEQRELLDGGLAASARSAVQDRTHLGPLRIEAHPFSASGSHGPAERAQISTDLIGIGPK
jgi:hypothetical protein